MKKRIMILLLALLLAVSSTATAVYDSYRVELGDASYFVGWTFCPLDAHNAVVFARTDKEGKPWHVGWYRDGELFRDLAGYNANVYLEDRVIPRPVLWDGETLIMGCSDRKGAYRTVVIDGINCADPENYEDYFADWTENGLENRRPVPEDWYEAQQLGRVMFSRENGTLSLRIDGQETVLPEAFLEIPTELVFNLDCIPAGEERCLLSWRNDADSYQYIACVDHGRMRSEVVLSMEDAWLIMPDADGGFLSQIGWNTGDYTPVSLAHYSADGERDRVLQLKGDRMVVRAMHTVADGETGNVILYGTAVAQSRYVYTAFAMTLDRDLNVTDLDVRNIDGAYRAYSPDLEIAPDGTAWLLIGDVDGKPAHRPVMIPFSALEKSNDDHGLTLE